MMATSAPRRESLVLALLMPIVLAVVAGLYEYLFKPATTPPESLSAGAASSSTRSSPSDVLVCGLLEEAPSAAALEGWQEAFALAYPLGFSGPWKTNYGPLSLYERSRGRVTGFYLQGQDVGLVEGQVNTQQLRFSWKEAGGRRTGRGWFELLDGGERLSGEFGFHGRSEGGGKWMGSRDKTGWKPPVPSEDFGRLEGLWRTNWGMVEIARDGASADGCYTFEEKGQRVRGHFEGYFEGPLLFFRWLEQDAETRDQRKGNGVFWLSGKDKIQGVWGFDDSRRNGGSWQGTREPGFWGRPPPAQ